MFDNLEAFFHDPNFSKQFVGTLPPPAVVAEPAIPEQHAATAEENTTAYAQAYVEREIKALRERFSIGRNPHHLRLTDEDRHMYGMLDSKYTKWWNDNLRRPTPNLPIHEPVKRKEIEDKIRRYPVVVLKGPTGCGKTTQVPQFIFDDAVARGERCNIVICQPRRVAAATNANRVASERDKLLANVVGYQVGLDARANRNTNTRILFCTTGILLEKLIHSAKQENPLGEYTHIILDEVHERDKNMDFLFIVLKKLMNPNVKVILMSATIDAERFAEYFAMPIGGRMVNAPCIEIIGTSHTVHEYYYEDLEKMEKRANPNYQRPFHFDRYAPKVHDEIYLWALRLIAMFEAIDRKENEIAEHPNPNYESSPKPTVLVFLPGINEIHTMHQYLTLLQMRTIDTKLIAVIMHSGVDTKQTTYALQESTRNERKIVLATNMAESSITVPNLKYVIDFCLTRNLITDTKTNFTTLRLDWASRTNCEQRKGRAGRQMEGRCYRLVPREFYRNMRGGNDPELKRSPLENTVLKTKILGMGTPEEILALAMDKPKLQDISNTILQLKEIGALFRTMNGVYSKRDGDITFIGQVMADLPLDVRLTKLLIFGYCFSILRECIVIAAALNCTHSMFRPKANDEVNFYSQILRWANGSGGDLFAMLHVYNAWRHKRKTSGEAKTLAELRAFRDEDTKWATRYGLNTQGLYECHQYVEEIKNRLIAKGISTKNTDVKWKYNDKTIILKVVIAGAFYPNYFERTRNDEREAFKAINGLDPRNTVYFSNFATNHDRCFYVKKIKEYFLREKIVTQDDLVNVKVTFAGSEKAFVTFKHCEEPMEGQYGTLIMPGKILPEVYKSVKAFRSRRNLHLNVMQNDYAIQKVAEDRGLTANEDGAYKLTGYVRNKEDYCVPRMKDRKVDGVITHVDNCGRFWLQPLDSYQLLSEFYEELNGQGSSIERFNDPRDIYVEQLLAAHFVTRNESAYYRAKVLKIIHNEQRKPEKFKVLFVDFGNTHDCVFDDLRRLSGVAAAFIDIPPRCFECCLTEVQPAVLDAENSTWSTKANKWFGDTTDGREVTAHVHSVVNGISSVFITIKNFVVNEHLTIDEFNVNDYLIKHGYADFCEESYASKANHANRMYFQQNPNIPNSMDPELFDFLQKEAQREIEPPPESLCTSKTRLKGPQSPLETTITAMIECSRYQIVSIDSNSVNCVLLNNDPQEHASKFMVAASVTQKPSSSELMARHTTLMPCIRGFGAMMALIFSPTMEIKRDTHKSRYTSLITGLGYDESRHMTYFEEHDIKFDLDVEFSEEDIADINKIRYRMDTLLFTKPGAKHANVFTRDTKVKMTKEIKDLIVRLLEKPRKSIENNGGIKWNSMTDVAEDIVQPETTEYGHRSIFPLHRTLKLFPLKPDVALKLRKNCEELHKMKNLSTTVLFARAERCQLCQVELNSATDIRYHLVSRLHTDREADIGFQYTLPG